MSTSIFPASARIVDIASFTEALLVTSISTTLICVEWLSNSAFTLAFLPLGLRIVANTLLPLSAKSFAAFRPNPLLLPVMITFFILINNNFLKSKHSVIVCQSFGRYFLNHVPMFYDFPFFHSEQVIKSVFLATIPFTFAYGKYEITFTQHFMDFGVFKHIVLRSEILYCFHYAG